VESATPSWPSQDLVAMLPYRCEYTHSTRKRRRLAGGACGVYREVATPSELAPTNFGAPSS